MGKSNKSLELTPEVAAGSGATIRVNGGGCAWSAGQLNSLLHGFTLADWVHDWRNVHEGQDGRY